MTEIISFEECIGFVFDGMNVKIACIMVNVCFKFSNLEGEDIS